MNSKTKTAIIAASVAAVVGVFAAGGARFVMKRAGTVSVEEFERGFRRTCVSECESTGGTAATCGPPCECTLTRLYAGRPHEDVVRSVTSRTVNGLPNDELRAEIEAHSLECVSDQYDENFVASCASEVPAGSTPERQTAHCRCLLTSLRQGMGRGEGTRWMLQNLEREPMTEAGFEGVHRATAACPTE